MMDLSGVVGDGTLGKSNAEQERPYLAAVVPKKACNTTRWREGALL